MKNRYRISSPDVVFEEFGGEMVILNLASGQYFGLNPAGAVSWGVIASGASITDIAATPEIATKLVVFAERLEALGLVVPAEDGIPVNDSNSGSTLAFEGTPSVDVFDDLADLIVADPIHDVDTGAGWPVKPTV